MNAAGNQEVKPPVVMEVPIDTSKLHTDQAEQFAKEYVANAGADMNTAIKRIKLNARIVMILALFLSMPHQVSYLLALAWPHTKWGSIIEIVESCGMLMLAVGTPVVADLWIVNSINTISTVAASTGSKIRAIVGMFLPVGVSGTVNFIAPAPTLIRFLAVFVVLAIPGNEVLKFIKPDWIKLRKLTNETMEKFAPPEPVQVQRRARPRKGQVIRILGANPEMKVREVAKRAGVSENYVHLIKRELRENQKVTA